MRAQEEEREGRKQGGLKEDKLFSQSIFTDNQTISQRCLLKRLDCGSP